VVPAWSAGILLLRPAAASERIITGVCGIQYGARANPAHDVSRDNSSSGIELVRGMESSLAVETDDTIDDGGDGSGYPSRGSGPDSKQQATKKSHEGFS